MPYQSGDHCTSHKQSRECAINCTESRHVLSEIEALAILQKTMFHWLHNDINLLGEKQQDSRNRKSAGISVQNSSVVWLHLPAHIATHNYSAKQTYEALLRKLTLPQLHVLLWASEHKWTLMPMLFEFMYDHKL